VIVQADRTALSCGSYVFPWFVIKTKWKMECDAAQRVSEQGFPTLLPEHEVTVMVRRVKTKVVAPLFPNYIFASFDTTRMDWRSIAHTRGVESILGSDILTPTPLPPGVIDALIKRPITEPVAHAPNLIGKRVQVISGPFQDLAGVCKWSSEKRVRVLLGLLGGGTVEVNRDNVRIV